MVCVPHRLENMILLSRFLAGTCARHAAALTLGNKSQEPIGGIYVIRARHDQNFPHRSLPMQGPGHSTHSEQEPLIPLQAVQVPLNSELTPAWPHLEHDEILEASG